MTEIDHGARCDRHVGEVFPPRCTECETAKHELVDQERAARHERALQRAAALAADRPNLSPRTIRRPSIRARR
jgi:hypothetical protein